MTAIITALVGLVGVLVGVLLSFFLQRRLWQTQEAMKAYSELFAVGDETLRRCNNVACIIDNFNIEEAHKENALFRQQYDPVFRRMLRQCWMLERDVATRARIEEIQQKYLDCKVGLHLRFDRALDRSKQTFDNMIANQPTPESLFPLLESLQHEVAAKYFHNADASQGNTKPGEHEP